MKKYTKIIVSLCLGLSANLAMAYDGGAFPGYVASPASKGSSTVIKTQFGECVKNQYFQPGYQREECGEVIKRENLTISSKVLFAFDKYALSEAGKQTLTHLIERAKQDGEIDYINITGYTDKIGTENENQILSQNRANAVGDYFVSLGIDPTYINAKGDGENNSHVSDGCFAKDGPDPTDRMDEVTRQAETAQGEEKVKLDSELKKLDTHLATLSKCTAPDRRVDITIETKGSANPQ